ncbi:HNH endonuclease [Robertmurraya massiliosenegalensis]|uniref:HNH endonuclease n=1 Tax=Robertmurraya massiliosenegalensis TaxID=1287657 RepID=UPI0003676292|nr:HNH endonuclease [Robertmurraya massiliosenegalensis]
MKRVDSKRIDLTGKKFGELTVIKLSDKRGNNNTLLWECKCSCSKTIYVHGYSLTHEHYKSCGCKREGNRDKAVKEHIEKDRVDGTRKTALKAKLHKGNKSGHKGVMWMERRQKWRAYIGFQGKQINLGYFEDLEDAIKARQAGEEKYHKPLLEDNNNE